MATLAQVAEQMLNEAEEVRQAGGLTDADMLARMPASQRAGFLKGIGALKATPDRNSLDRSSAPDDTERRRRIRGAASCVAALRALSSEDQEDFATARRQMTPGGDDLTDILNKPMSLDEMIQKAGQIGGR